MLVVTRLSSEARNPRAPCLLSTLTNTTSPVAAISTPLRSPSSLPDVKRTITALSWSEEEAGVHMER